MRFLTDAQLRSEKGLDFSPATMWRQRKQRRLPQKRQLTSRLGGTPEPVATKYTEALALGHTQEEAVIIAEEYLKQLLSSKNAA
jgi:hypothetical protein